MKLKVKLKDQKYCNGCPYYELSNTDGELAPDVCCRYNCLVIRGIRPQKCVKENGK